MYWVLTNIKYNEKEHIDFVRKYFCCLIEDNYVVAITVLF